MLQQKKQHNHYFKEKSMHDMTKALDRVLKVNQNWTLCLFELVKTDDYFEAIGVYEETYNISLRRGLTL